jgi:hypothetical protein
LLPIFILYLYGGRLYGGRLYGGRLDQYQDDRKGAHDDPERGFKTLAFGQIMTDASTDNRYGNEEHGEAHLLFPLRDLVS